MGQWLDLQPYLDEVARFTLEHADDPIPEQILASLLTAGRDRSREELLKVASAAIAVIRSMDQEAAGG